MLPLWLASLVAAAEARRAMRGSRSRLVALGVLWLAACAGEDAWRLAGQPGLLLKVQQYYESYGTEEGGRCTAPIMDGVARSEVLEDTPEQMMIRLSYYYRDYIRDGDDCGPLRPLRCNVLRECRGFAQRIFTIDKGQDGLGVVGMSGGQRGVTPRRN